MALSCYNFITPPSLSLLHIHRPSYLHRYVSYPMASLSSSSSPSPDSKAPPSQPQGVPSLTASTTSSATPFVESRPPEPAFNHAFSNSNGNPLVRIVQNTESSIERVIFDLLLGTPCCWRFFGWLTPVLPKYVYLAGTVMLIFGMGLYGLFISNTPSDVSPSVDRALKGSSLFGMFALKERPKWMKISSLDELKTKVGQCYCDDSSCKNV